MKFEVVHIIHISIDQSTSDPKYIINYYLRATLSSRIIYLTGNPVSNVIIIYSHLMFLSGVINIQLIFHSV